MQDYLIAEGYNHAVAKGNAVTLEAKYCFSQDGVRCVSPCVGSDTKIQQLAQGLLEGRKSLVMLRSLVMHI